MFNGTISYYPLYNHGSHRNDRSPLRNGCFYVISTQNELPVLQQLLKSIRRLYFLSIQTFSQPCFRL